MVRDIIILCSVIIIVIYMMYYMFIVIVALCYKCILFNADIIYSVNKMYYYVLD